MSWNLNYTRAALKKLGSKRELGERERGTAIDTKRTKSATLCRARRTQGIYLSTPYNNTCIGIRYGMYKQYAHADTKCDDVRKLGICLFVCSANRMTNEVLSDELMILDDVHVE